MNILFLLSLLLTSITFAVEPRASIVNVSHKYITFNHSHEDIKPIFSLAERLMADFLGYPFEDFKNKYSPLFKKMAKILETGNDLNSVSTEYYKQLQKQGDKKDISEYELMSYYLEKVLNLFNFLINESLLVSPDNPPLNPIQKIQRLIRFSEQFKNSSYTKTKNDTKSNIFMYQPILSGDTIKIIFINVSNASSLKEAQAKLKQRLDFLVDSKEITISESLAFNFMSLIRIFHKSPQ